MCRHSSTRISFFWARDRENYTPVGFQGATLLVPRRKVTDDAPGVAYLFPSQKLCKPRHPKIAEAEKEISRMRCSSKQKLATAIHEGNHFLTAKRFGLNPKYDGQAIEHVKETDHKSGKGWQTKIAAV